MPSYPSCPLHLPSTCGYSSEELAPNSRCANTTQRLLLLYFLGHQLSSFLLRLKNGKRIEVNHNRYRKRKRGEKINKRKETSRDEMKNGCWPTASAGQVLLPQRRGNRGNCSYPVFLEPTFPLSKSCEYPPVKSAELYFRFHLESDNFYGIQFKPMVSTGDLTRKNSLGMFAEGKHRLSNRCYNSMPHAENVSDITWLLGNFHDRTWEIKVDVKDAMRRRKESKVVCCGLRPSCINQTGVHQSNMMLTCQGR